MVLDYELAPARASVRVVLPELDPPPGTIGIGDRGFRDPALRERLAARGVEFLAPYQHKSRDPNRVHSAKLSAIRYRIETVNEQLAERYRIERTWARDQWRLCHRLIRKILSHTVMIWVAATNGIPPLTFASPYGRAAPSQETGGGGRNIVDRGALRGYTCGC